MKNKEFVFVKKPTFFIFPDLYEPTGEILGNGAYAAVRTYRKIASGKEYAVKV